MIVYPDDRGKDLGAVLTGMIGRRLTVAEIHSALEMPYTTYDAQRKQGRLINCINLVKAARNLGINELELLLRYRLISPEAFEQHAREVLTPLITSEAPERRQTTRPTATPPST
jgi:hypothetical protein